MIDFRYHLVSLISVFLALAVGIVLGAGPLKEPIGDSLQSQVDALRTDRDNLRTELEEERASVEELDQFVVAAAPELLAESLTDAEVAIVGSPGADADALTALDGRLSEAGAEVVMQVSLAETALDPEGAGELIETLRGIDPSLPDGAAEALTTALSRALTAGAGDPAAGGEEPAEEAQAGSDTAPGTPEPTGTEAPADAGPTVYTADQAAEVITAFSDDGRLTGSEYAAAGSVMFVAPPAAETPAEAEATESTAPPQSEPDSVGATFATALAAGAPTVVTGTRASAERGLVSALRSDDSGITTADGLEVSAGPVIAALALEQAIAGNPGAFGFADNAQSVVPGAER